MRGRLDSAGWGWEGVELVERCFVRVVVSWLCRVEEREVKSCVKTDSTVPSHNTAWRRGRGEGERGSEKGGKRGGKGRIKEVMKSCCFVFHTAKKAVTLAVPPPT